MGSCIYLVNNRVKSLKLSILILTSIFSTTLSALPVLEQISAGSIQLENIQDSVLEIQQNTNKAIIDWNNFNINANEKVHFSQPANAICLNRIDSASGLTKVHGELSATSNIILLNQAGVLFTPHAQINVGSIVATSADISDNQFLSSEQLDFKQTTDVYGPIINHGQITVRDGGIAALLGSSVRNTGKIIAKYAQIELKASKSFVVDFNGDGVINYAISTTPEEKVDNAVFDENNERMHVAVENSGIIINNFGNVVISASAAPDIFDSLINMSGEIKAQRLTSNNGVIIIGDEHGHVDITGSIDVTNHDGNLRIIGPCRSGIPQQPPKPRINSIRKLPAGSIIAVSDSIQIGENAELKFEGGWLALGDSTGHVKYFDGKTTALDYKGMHDSLPGGNTIPANTTAHAIKMFYDYKRLIPFNGIKDLIDIDIQPRMVNIDFTLNGKEINMRSMRPEDYKMVHYYLNSQPLVRGKYADRQIKNLQFTENRIKVLADRFNPDVTDECFMHGGFIIKDKETQQFLGVINSGTSLDPNILEMGYMSRPDVWSQKPDNIAQYNISPNEFLTKDYSGLSTAAVQGLLQYEHKLKELGYTIKGEEIHAMRASSMIENPASWKVLAKNGFELKSVYSSNGFSPDLRYRLEYNL